MKMQTDTKRYLININTFTMNGINSCNSDLIIIICFKKPWTYCRINIYKIKKKLSGWVVLLIFHHKKRKIKIKKNKKINN